MYSTCIFCHASLGANASIEHFPIGRRVAFDGATGRLWAVCHACERWNLSPIEERWEALEECEVAFRSTRLRFSTDQIGLARTRDGTQLIRIGRPLRPEMAAWRYGDQFGRRRRRRAIVVGTVVLGAGALYAAGLTVGVMAVVSANLAISLANRASRTRIRLCMRIGDTLVRLSTRTLGAIELRPDADGGYELRIPVTGRRARDGQRWLTLRGNDVISAAALLLPNINARGADERTTRESLDLLENFADADEAFRSMATADRSHRWFRGDLDADSLMSDPLFLIGRLGTAQRLCLEMIAHEEEERRAMEGELVEFESRWKEAEEIAQISDALLTAESS